MSSAITTRHRFNAAAPVAGAIQGVEQKLNELTVTAGNLFSSIGAARLDRRARMDLTTGMEAAERAAVLVTMVAAAYRQSVSVHKALAEDKGQLGLPTTAFGDIYPTFGSPPSGDLDADTPSKDREDVATPLRIVA